jgi:hypothetical protein
VAAAPKIITARQIGLEFRILFGELGPEHWVTGHHTAGPIDTSDAHAISLCKSYHAAHAAKGWGGVGYHFCITRRGTIIGLRPLYLKGTHVGSWNSTNVGVMFHGTTGNKPTKRQAQSYRWLLRNCHTSKMPSAHRADRPLHAAAGTRRRGHNDWPGHQWNACPGTHKHLIVTGVRD